MSSTAVHLPPVDEPLRVLHEEFAQAFVEMGNASAAYRRVYDPTGKQPSQQIWTSAAKLVAHPDLAIRIRQLRDAAAAGALVRAIDLMRDWYDIATADPNEISSVIIQPCRNCYGVDHGFQWVDEREYARAYDDYGKRYAQWAALDARTRERHGEPQPPDLSGGFGYDAKADPVMDCPHCFGKGLQDVMLRDTTKLSPAARKLYKSAEKDRFGAIKVNIHDQEAAREKLARCLGAFKDGVGVPGVVLPEQAQIKPDATDEDATRRYLAMVQR